MRQKETEMLQEIWESNKGFLRRLLIGFTRDIDLADDLLQETYLKAMTGIGGYRGGDVRSWLSTIARNVFYAHLRQKFRHNEAPMDESSEDIPSPMIDPTTNLDLIELKRAISDLSPANRTALIMKHYGGFTYEEIARQLSCPVGTAKWRVSEAIKALRASLREELACMECKDLAGTVLIDYVYGILPKQESERVKAHLESCAECLQEVDELTRVVTALNECQSDYKLTSILELDENGLITFYYAQKAPITVDLGDYQLAFPKRHEVSHIVINGSEIPFQALPVNQESAVSRYKANLPRQLKSDDRPDLLVIGHQRSDECNPKPLGCGKWRLVERYPVKAGDNEWILVFAIRLPSGARLLNASPEPSEIRSNVGPTLVWKRMLIGSELMEYQVEYQL